ncbi:MAG: serine/threonine-protein kinase [Pirellulaceae bacterium]
MSSFSDHAFDETDDPRVLAAMKDFMSQLDAGKQPCVDEFLDRYSVVASQLRPALEGLAMVHGAAGPAKDRAVPTVPEAEFTAKPIGDFQIVGELGRGGMGIVYEAVQMSLGRRVALKVLPFASGLDASRLQRFRNEAHAAAQLHHTNIVPVHAVGSDRGVQYYAMQLIEGQTLAELIDRLREVNPQSAGHASATLGESAPLTGGATQGRPRRLSHGDPRDGNDRLRTTLLTDAGQRKLHYRTMVQLAHQATLALEHAHQYGVVHRDIKPGNLLLDTMSKLWVTDFGLAQIEQAEMQLTRSGHALGTVRYMSPEQAAGNRLILDHRTDIYSLGVTLYEMLTLRPAIVGNDYRAMLNQVAEQEPTAPRIIDPALPIELDTIILKAIAKDPAARYATAKAFGDDLLAWLDDKPIAAKPPTLWQWLGKWRKRNRRLVNVAAGLLVASSIGMLITTLMVVREQQRTAAALRAEKASFEQARRAVDTFSELSETELAYRPEFQNLRRRILETSLTFYRDFLAQRAGDIGQSQDLLEASAKVERMVEELKLLDDVAPLLLLGDPHVREELGIDPKLGEQLLVEISEIQNARANLGDDSGPLLAGASEEIGTHLRSFVRVVGNAIDDAHMNRLRQILRQQQLPFTFLTMEVGDALQLSAEQRQEISKIIHEERPRHGPPDGEFRPNPGRGFNQNRPPPPDRFGGGEGPSGRGPGGNRVAGGEFQVTTTRTVAKILEILTVDQRAKWNALVGKPFEFHRRPEFR